MMHHRVIVELAIGSRKHAVHAIHANRGQQNRDCQATQQPGNITISVGHAMHRALEIEPNQNNYAPSHNSNCGARPAKVDGSERSVVS